MKYLLQEETVAGDVAPASQKLGKMHKKCTPNKPCNKKEEIKEARGIFPTDKLISAGIKVKTSDMDDDSYVILLFKKDDVQKSIDILEKDGYEVQAVNKLLYIS